MSAINDIKVQTTRRNDGRVTVTVKLIGWTPDELNRLGHGMETAIAYAPVRQLGIRLRNAVIGALNT